MSRLLQACDALRRHLVVEHAYVPLSQALPGLEGAEALFDLNLAYFDGPDLRLHAVAIDQGDAGRTAVHAEDLRRHLQTVEERIPGRIKATVWILADSAVRAAQLEGPWFDAEDGHFLAKTLVARGVLCLETLTGTLKSRVACQPEVAELAKALDVEQAPSAAAAADLLRRREQDELRSRHLLQGSSMPVTWALIAANAVIYGMQLAWSGQGEPVGPAAQHAWYDTLIAMGANVPDLVRQGQTWRLFTAFFLHGGLLHVAMNMLSLYQLGRLGESLMGPWRFLLLYLCCGLAGSLGTAFFGPGQIPSLGASGALFGIAGALMAPRWRRDPRFPEELARRLFQWLVRPLDFFLVLGVVLSRLDQPVQLDNFAHLGGLLCGFTIAYAYPPFLIRRTDKRI